VDRVRPAFGQNGSDGSDHGAGGGMFVVGQPVIGGLYRRLSRHQRPDAAVQQQNLQ
jgi:uncharacterized protein (DUF1501 family)